MTVKNTPPAVNPGPPYGMKMPEILLACTGLAIGALIVVMSADLLLGGRIAGLAAGLGSRVESVLATPPLRPVADDGDEHAA